ncbi:MAG TPA: hypothetical protein EYP07_01700, partial [Kiloniellaceae bacterium]|nr:hypothetical protein [Kiloniellaceae bacterium]
DTGTTTFTHDEAGNPISQTDARGITGSQGRNPHGFLPIVRLRVRSRQPEGVGDGGGGPGGADPGGGPSV